jgi:hypothetical protein
MKRLISEISLDLKYRLLNKLDNISDRLGDSSEPKLLYYANIEGLAARFTVEQDSGVFQSILFSLGGEYSFVYPSNTTEKVPSVLDAEEGFTPTLTATPEGRVRTEKQAVKFVLSCVRDLDPDLPYCAVCYNNQRGFYRIARRLGFAAVGEFVFRLPNGQGGFLTPTPLFSQILSYCSKLDCEGQVLTIAYKVDSLKKLLFC